jgi:hypothetical protein
MVGTWTSTILTGIWTSAALTGSGYYGQNLANYGHETFLDNFFFFNKR